MSDKKIGFTCGAFDIVHPGHVRLLRESKANCDYLIVGLQIDPTIDRPDTKNVPVQTLEERFCMLNAIKYVDEIKIYETEDDLYRMLKELKPDIRFLGTDYNNRKFTGDDLDIKIHYHPRNHGWSSNGIRKRIFNAEKWRCGSK